MSFGNFENSLIVFVFLKIGKVPPFTFETAGGQEQRWGGRIPIRYSVSPDDNRISPEGAVLLGKGLQVNPALKILKMDRNPLQSAGCYVILNFILKNANKTMKVLTFEVRTCA
ncbi:unnamed protein product [Dibothriocephalus latus]|uniref:Uncharacterized protein n=1 Tax=Dibothriocephalus latus TaxID=60516 RepID=A0A3P7PJ74_DIBLA|nr:unnamed protein product [Dibothriocephalus latus]